MTVSMAARESGVSGDVTAHNGTLLDVEALKKKCTKEGEQTGYFMAHVVSVR